MFFEQHASSYIYLVFYYLTLSFENVSLLGWPFMGELTKRDGVLTASVFSLYGMVGISNAEAR